MLDLISIMFVYKTKYCFCLNKVLEGPYLVEKMLKDAWDRGRASENPCVPMVVDPPRLLQPLVKSLQIK